MSDGDLSDELLGALEDEADGLSFAELQERFSPPWTAGQLRYRLDQLRASGDVVRRGPKIHSRYYSVSAPAPEPARSDQISLLRTDGALAVTSNRQPPAPTSQDEQSGASSGIFSPRALEVLQRVRVPLTQRRPVGYQADLLNACAEPGHRFFSEREREQLAVLGRTGREDEPAGTYARLIYERLLIDLSWASSRLEGNTYSILDTDRLFKNIDPENEHSAVETQMLLNHKSAIEFLVKCGEDRGMRRQDVLGLHALLSANLLGDSSAEGRLRKRIVGIDGSVYQPLSNPHLLEQYFEQILATYAEYDDPFEQSFLLFIHIPYLQPFEDVNKRTSRMSMNIPLIQNNLCPMSFIDVPRDEYTQALLVFYETGELLPARELFLWGYARSSQRYQIVHDQVPRPNPLRLRYHKLIAELVREIVATRVEDPHAFMRARVPDTITGAERVQLIALVRTELSALHPGKLAQYQLMEAEFEVWAATRAVD